MATLDLDPAPGAFDPAELQRHLDGRYAELRAHAGAYVDAFGIPDAVLRAPIGLAEDR